MWWNEKVLINFLKNRPDTYWDIRSIPLSELGAEHPEELTTEQLVELLDYILVLMNTDWDCDIENYKFNIKIKFDGEPYYLLEMIWD